MGFFDKKSRLLRKKIKDLQGELRAAEKQGEYDVKDGVFFAKLEAMGDQTMMAFAAADVLSTREESVIEQFFQRNGFHVERLKIDKSTGRLADFYVEPPQELIMAMGKDLKHDGYRMIDDSEHGPRPLKLEEKVFPLSALLDIATALFAERVRLIIASTEIRNNKEGARLLTWMPGIQDYFANKYGVEALEIAHGPFDLAYGRLYSGVMPAVQAPQPKSQSERLKEYRQSQEQRGIEGVGGVGHAQASTRHAGHAPTVRGAPPPPPSHQQAGRAGQPDVEALRGASPTASLKGMNLRHPPEEPAPPPPPRHVGGPLPPRAPSAAAHIAIPAAPLRTVQGGASEAATYQREAHFHKTRAAIYKSLVRASSGRCVKNATMILEAIRGFFEAAAACILARPSGQDGLMLFALSGEELQWGGQGGGMPISTSVITECSRQLATVTSDDVAGGGTPDPSGSMLALNIQTTMATPVMIDGELAAVVYLDRRRAGIRRFQPQDKSMFEEIVQVFSEFGDLTLGTV